MNATPIKSSLPIWSRLAIQDFSSRQMNRPNHGTVIGSQPLRSVADLALTLRAFLKCPPLISALASPQTTVKPVSRSMVHFSSLPSLLGTSAIEPKEQSASRRRPHPRRRRRPPHRHRAGRLSSSPTMGPDWGVDALECLKLRQLSPIGLQAEQVTQLSLAPIPSRSHRDSTFREHSMQLPGTCDWSLTNPEVLVGLNQVLISRTSSGLFLATLMIQSAKLFPMTDRPRHHHPHPHPRIGDVNA